MTALCPHQAPASCKDCDGTTAELTDEQLESLLALDAPEEAPDDRDR